MRRHRRKRVDDDMALLIPMRFQYIIAVLFATSAVTASEPSAVARIGSKVITYEDIRCRGGAELHAVAKSERLETACHRLEQQALERKIWPDLLAAAASRYHLEPTKEDIVRAIPRGLDPVAIAHRFDIMAQAVLQIMSGGSEEAARHELLEPNHITEAEFAAFRLNFRSADQVKKYLQRDNTSTIRSSLEQQQRVQLIVQRLRARVTDQAKRSGRAEADVASEMWSELMTSAGLSLVDRTYHLPSMKGVLIP